MMDKIVFILLIINTCIGLGFLLVSPFRKKGQFRFLTALYGVLIILCPGLGLCLVLGIQFAYKFLPEKQIDLSDVSFSHKKLDTAQAPDEEEEMRITPLQDMFLVGSNEEKRRAMFFVLKQDIERYLGTISHGIADEDSETSHYVASSVMKYSADFALKIQQIAVIYQQDPTDYEVNRTYADAVFRYLSTQTVMSDMVRKKYRYLYCDLMDNMSTYNSDRLSLGDYENVIRTRLDLQDASNADKWVHACREKFPDSENSYLAALEYYFRTGQNAAFKDCMEKLQASGIPLSAQGVNLLRFFSTQAAN